MSKVDKDFDEVIQPNEILESMVDLAEDDQEEYAVYKKEDEELWIKKINVALKNRTAEELIDGGFRQLQYAGRLDGELTQKERATAREFMEDKLLLLNILNTLHTPHNRMLVGESANALISLFTALSSITEDPQNLRVVGDSSTGKTWFVLSALQLIPEEMKIVLRGATKKSIYYDYGYEDVEGQKLKNKVVDFRGKVLVLLEEGESEEVLMEMKPLLSHDMREIKYKFVEKSGGGKQRTNTIILRGWPAYIGLTTKLYRPEELQTREWVTSPIEDVSKFEKVLDNQSMAEVYPHIYKCDLNNLREIQNGIRILKPLPVWAFLTPLIQQVIPTIKQPRVMRDFKKIISFVKISAFLHQYQRPHIFMNDKEYIIATLDDYFIAMMLADFMFRGTFTGITEKTRKVFDMVVQPVLENFEFENEEKKKEDKKYAKYPDFQKKYYEIFGSTISRPGIKKHLDQLITIGMIEAIDSQSRSRTFLGVTQSNLGVTYEGIYSRVKQIMTPESIAQAVNGVFDDLGVTSVRRLRYQDSDLKVEDLLGMKDILEINEDVVTPLQSLVNREELSTN